LSQCKGFSFGLGVSSASSTVLELGGNSIGDTLVVLCNTKGLEGGISAGGFEIGWSVGVDDASTLGASHCLCGCSIDRGGRGGGGGGGGGPDVGCSKTLLILAFRPKTLEVILGDASGLFLSGEEEAEDNNVGDILS
jgi:hypothetical protein